MTASELTEFCARVRRLFGGEMDEELWRLTRERLAGLKAKPCEAALDDYALAHGGGRSRFIPGKFFEFYGRRVVEHDDQTRRSAQRATSIARDVGGSLDARAVAEDWRAIRERVERLEPSRRAEIVSALRSAGWSEPEGSVSRWSRTWLLAVSDIASDRRVETRNPDTGVWDRFVDPLAFWGALGRGARIAQEASESNPYRKPSTGEERPGAARQAVSGDREAFSTRDLDPTEIPF